MLKYSIRQATIADAATIAAHRVAMFSDMGQVPTSTLADKLRAESASALSELLRVGSYVGWLAIDTAERIIAGAGAHLKPQLPRISDAGNHVATGPVPLVVNVYTEPAWRGQGIARALMKDLMEWALAKGCDRLLLHASDAGRPLYVSLGFVPTNEMRWTPTKDSRARYV
jgi:GNAT superfamily N-acetyltransferase